MITEMGEYIVGSYLRMIEGCDDVPDGRRGKLTPFRGKTVRIVCIGSEQFDRVLMAGEVRI